jgi:hypothetical protein
MRHKLIIYISDSNMKKKYKNKYKIINIDLASSQ